MLTIQQKQEAYARVDEIIHNTRPSNDSQCFLETLRKVTQCMSSYSWDLSEIADVLTPYRDLAEISGGEVYGAFINDGQQVEYKNAKYMQFSCTCLGALCAPVVEDIIKVFALDRNTVKVELLEGGDCQATYALK